MKVYYDNFTQIIQPYGQGTYRNPDFKVLDLTEEEALELADQLADSGIELFVIDYKAEKGIGELARHINQCYGTGYASWQRDLWLRNQMRAYIKKHNFPAIFTLPNSWRFQK